MEDKHAYPTGMRFTTMARDIDEMQAKENFNGTELTETLGKLRL